MSKPSIAFIRAFATPACPFAFPDNSGPGVSLKAAT